MSGTDDKLLIKSMQKGHIKAFDRLFYQYNKKIYHFCKQVLSSDEDAKELTQEIFIAVWNNRMEIDSNRSFSAYIFAIARNMINNTIRNNLQKKAYIDYMTSTGISGGDTTLDQVIFNDLKDKLEIIIDNLPPKTKEVFQLSRNHGYSYKEIASKLKITENTVDTQVRRALNQIRQGLQRLL